MAITFDAALGGAAIAAGGVGVPVTITTSAAAASGSRVVVIFSWFNAGTAAAPTCTVGGTSATLDKRFDNGSDHLATFSLVVGGGLASSSTIACTDPNGGSGGNLAAACSYLGTTGVDTAASTNTGTTAAAWSTGAATNTIADAVYVAAAATDGTLASESSSQVVGNERFDLFNASSGQGAVMQDLVVSSIASTAITGTWGTTTGLTTQTMSLLVYKGTASAAAAGPFGHPNLPFMAPQGGIL